MLSHDQPINKPCEDLYKRSHFALTIARSITNLTVASDGFAFAITGEWGTGKSSVIRLIERYLRHLQMEQLSRSPLWWQEKETPKTVDELEEMALLYEKAQPHVTKLLEENKYLLRASLAYQQEFFENLTPTSEDALKALYYWHLLEIVNSSPEVVVVQFSPWLIAGRAELASALISELARAASTNLGDPLKEAFQKLLERLSELAPVAGAGLDLATPGAGQIFRTWGNLSGSVAKRMTSGPTLDALRTKLQSILRGLPNRRILVVVDDVDRLTPPEATEMISLIKSLGDLPNVVYLMSYDRATICNLINKALRVNGEKYLEKIVQTHIELPPIDEDDLVASVELNLKRLFSGITLDEKRLGSLWYAVLRHYIRNPRDARRYFNSIALSYPGLAQFTDPIDLMALQALQVFEPKIYTYVREHLSELAS